MRAPFGDFIVIQIKNGTSESKEALLFVHKKKGLPCLVPFLFEITIIERA
jgi:hypothetical protein